MRNGNDGRNGNPIAHEAVKIGMSVPPQLPPEAVVEVSISQSNDYVYSFLRLWPEAEIKPSGGSGEILSCALTPLPAPPFASTS